MFTLLLPKERCNAAGHEIPSKVQGAVALGLRNFLAWVGKCQRRTGMTWRMLPLDT